MSSIKVKFRPSSVADAKGAIYYQIIHDRIVRQLPTPYRIFPSEWDKKRSSLSAGQSTERASIIKSINREIHADLERLAKIDRKLKSKGIPYTTDKIIDEYTRYTSEFTLFNFMETIIAKLKQNGKYRTAETYKSSLNSFKKFRNGEDIMLDCLTSEIMEDYEAWHHNRGVTPNTISFYTRILRAVYNRAVDNEIIENRLPFRHVYTGVDRTVKRALPLEIIRKIKSLDLRASPALDYARDMFLISFYFRGMSFIDMAFLRKTDLRNGSITYRRRKTGQLLIIQWTPEMQHIIDKYPPNTSKYLLPIIKRSGINERCTYHNVGYNINHNLKQIAKLVNIEIPLTMYVARHSWASAAKSKGIPIAVISEAMGHDSETTTQIYLASLDTSVVDKANSLIISSL